MNRDFVDKHVAFRIGNDDIGYGLRPEHALQKKAKNAADAGGSKPISFDEYARFVSKYDVNSVAKLANVEPERLRRLAQLYADPKTKVMSFWTMGFNQHTRGVWANHLVYNLHLLTGKISTPGNSPFSLTGQPSACGTAREVGVFSHRLPADMVVMNPKHRAIAEEIWKLPGGTIPEKPGFHAVLQSRMLKDGQLNCYWTQTTNNMQAGPNSQQEIWPGWRKPENFVVVSDVYPTDEHRRRGPDPALRDVGGEGGRLRQRRAAHAVLAPARQRARGVALGSLADHGVFEALSRRRGVAGRAAREGARVQG